MSKAKQRGTAAETAIVRYLHERGHMEAHRRALKGSQDEGDVVDRWPPTVVIESKARKTASSGQPGDAELAKWHAELIAEMATTGAPRGAVVCKRAGYGASRAAHWWAYIPLELLVGGQGVVKERAGWPVGREGLACVTLGVACELLGL